MATERTVAISVWFSKGTVPGAPHATATAAFDASAIPSRLSAAKEIARSVEQNEFWEPAEASVSNVAWQNPESATAVDKICSASRS